MAKGDRESNDIDFRMIQVEQLHVGKSHNGKEFINFVKIYMMASGQHSPRRQALRGKEFR